MRFGNVEVRPLGGGLGCLFMLLFSVVASVLLTVLVNPLLRQHLRAGLRPLCVAPQARRSQEQLATVRRALPGVVLAG